MLTSSTDLHPTTRYAAEVVSGLRNVCKREWQSCERHLKDLQRQGTEEFPYVFDESRADRIFDWFESCCYHVRGPFSNQLIELQPFQKFDLGCVFGWVHKDTGQRRFRKSFNERARGNVKSTEMSGVALYGMCSDCIYPPDRPDRKIYEDSPEIECAAVDKDQAKRIWLDARAMGEKSPDISKRLRICRTYVEHRSRGGWMRPLSKDTKNKDSGAPCIVIIDEYHEHRTSDIHDTLLSGFGKRWQSLMMIITTAGKDAENSPAKKEYDICCRILDGSIIDETYFVMIRELDKDDDPHDKDTWVKANPILQTDNDYSRILRGEIEADYNLAYSSGDPAKIREFLIKRVNLWQAESEAKYFDKRCMDRWKELAVSREEFLKLVRGRACYTGLDMSKRIDLTADGSVFLLDDGRYAVCAHGFIPEGAVNMHEHTDRIPYRAWAKDGWCTITEGDVTDDEYVKQHIYDAEMDEKWKVQEVCYDAYGARQLAVDMSKKGYQCVEIIQGTKTLSEPTKKFRELVLQRKLVHDGNPLLTWCVSNAYEVVGEGELVKLSKKHKDDTQRIDLLAAIINAMARAIVAQPKKIRYERGQMFLD